MYKVSRLIGGGESWWYLFAPCGRMIDGAHERHEHEVKWLYRTANLLNATIQHG